MNTNPSRHLSRAHDDNLADFEFRHGTMDDVFLALTGSVAEEAVA